ncbi:beta-glucosidase-related glycosidase [Geopyxis carbonaria]|nr:beta-glucosidase-related glycosidase [Geopyxis carbonaria]
MTAAGGWSAAMAKAEAFVEKLTLDEKVLMVTGATGPCTGNIMPVKRLGFNGLCLQDGPTAIRLADYASVFPAGVTVASSWDRDWFYKRGYAMAEEFKGKGSHILLGPVAGPLGRSALGGRNWEGFSPDPYLTGIAMEETIVGIQDTGVQATPKHFIGNEQETYRNPSIGEDGTVTMAVSANIDDRAMHELYLWPFADSVKAGAASMMCSYNRVNGSYGCQNSKTLNGLLKTELGFNGFVMSDWMATHAGIATIESGLDMDMPGNLAFNGVTPGSYFGGNLTSSIKNGSIPIHRLNDMIHRIMTPYFHLGQDKDFPSIDPSSAPLIFFPPWTYNSSDFYMEEPSSRDVRGNHGALIRKMAAESTVLLKNTKGALPLSKVKNIAVFGSDAADISGGLYNIGLGPRTEEGTLAVGGGSGTGRFSYIISPIEALKAKALKDNFMLQYITNNTLAATDISSIYPAPEVCLVFLNTYAGESFDRISFESDFNADAVVWSVAANCSNTMVVVHSAGINTMPWADHPNITAIVHAHLPGQESGNSLVDVLWGAVNPSGKLPYTLARKASDYNAPIVNVTAGVDLDTQIDFTESLLIDYRHFDAANKSVLYEFGHGLSYTTFSLTGLKASPASRKALPALAPGTKIVPGGLPSLWDTVYTASCTVANTGKVAGATVPQLYVTLHGAPEGTPPRQLRGFSKVKNLAPGASKEVKFELRRRDLSFWDVEAQQWRIPEGKITLSLGASSRDIKETVDIEPVKAATSYSYV